MKKKLLIFVLILTIFASSVFMAKSLHINNNVQDGFNDLSQIKHVNTLSMMLEQNAGEGDYELETRSTWPTQDDGYVFNATLSKCENGSKLRWDDENKIATTTWKVGGNTFDNIENTTAANAYTNEYVNPSATTTETKKIGLMYVSDYGFAAAPSAWTNILSFNILEDNGYCIYSVTSVNWMYMGLHEWTILRNSANTRYAFNVVSDGQVGFEYVDDSDFVFAVRPVFYLNSNVTYVSGDGTKTSPIRIN